MKHYFSGRSLSEEDQEVFHLMFFTVGFFNSSSIFCGPRFSQTHEGKEHSGSIKATAFFLSLCVSFSFLCL